MRFPSLRLASGVSDLPAWQAHWVLLERLVRVAERPAVDLFVAETPGDPAETLLVVHGGPEWDHTYLREPLVRLGGERRVVFADLRGCGRSTCGLPQSELTPARAVADLVTFISQLGPHPVDVLGFSYGGLLAQRLTVTAPDRVRRLIIASSSLLPVPPDAFAGWAERDVRLAAQAPVPEDGTSWTAERTRADAVSSAAANIWQLERLADYLKLLEQVHFTADWSRAWPDHSQIPPARPEGVVERLHALAKPILLLHGRQDMTFPASLIEPTLQLLPTAQAAVIDNAGHMAHVDQPDNWLSALGAYLEPKRRP